MTYVTVTGEYRLRSNVEELSSDAKSMARREGFEPPTLGFEDQTKPKKKR